LFRSTGNSRRRKSGVLWRYVALARGMTLYRIWLDIIWSIEEFTNIKVCRESQGLYRVGRIIFKPQ